MPKITKIPASISRYTSAPIDAPVKRKVAAYARVSTDSEELLTSYAAQDVRTGSLLGCTLMRVSAVVPPNAERAFSE